jgi:hypothetical protein
MHCELGIYPLHNSFVTKTEYLELRLVPQLITYSPLSTNDRGVHVHQWAGGRISDCTQ